MTAGTPEPRPHVMTTTDELALLVESVQDYAIFLLGPTGEIRSWNQGAVRIMGYPAEEALGRHFSMFYPEEDIVGRKPQQELATATAEGKVEDEGWRVRKDGRRFWANTIIVAQRNKDGRVTGFAKVTRDLTERRAGEERLRQSEELFRLLVSSVQDYAIFMLDPGGHIISWNAGAQRIKGYEPEEIIGKHFSVFYPKEDVESRKPWRELDVATAYGSMEDEGWRVRKDGSRFWANVIISAVRDSEGTLRGFAKVTRDITQRKRNEEMQRALIEQREARLQAEEERRRAESSYQVAQEANRAKDEFLMTLSHELRTPMTAILGWARLLPTMSPDDPMFREAIASIGRGAKLQASLIDDVLDVSRIVSGKMRLARESIDITGVLRGALEAVQPTADAKGITIKTTFPADLGQVVADPTRLQQVVWNLLSNAVKFTPKGGSVYLGARRISSQLQITVSDTGEGIELQFLPHVFEPFRQAENPQTRFHGGLGLGLSIVRYIVDAHGGTVTAESGGRGQGATFTVNLPIGVMVPAVQPRPNLGELGPERQLDPQRLANLTILLIDDDRESRELVRVVLQGSGAKVHSVESAEGALDFLDRQRPDLVITDIAMPSMDGFALARAIRQRPDGAGLKIVALTAFPAGTTSTNRHDFDAYFTKPIDPVDFVEAVARAVSGKTTRAVQ